MNVNVAYQEFAGEKVTTANGAPLPATDKHKGSDPKELPRPPRDRPGWVCGRRRPEGSPTLFEPLPCD